MTWNQPICGHCWNARNPGRAPVQVVSDERVKRRCAYCGHPTTLGIFVRDDPATVPYPTEEPNPDEGVIELGVDLSRIIGQRHGSEKPNP